MAKASAFDDVDVQAPNLESILVDDEVSLDHEWAIQFILEHIEASTPSS